MPDPDEVASEPVDPPAALAGERVRVTPASRDRHETSLPLLLLGAIISVLAIPQLAGPFYGGFDYDWIAGVLLTAAFAAIWLLFQWRATRRGQRYPAGFGIAAIIGLVLCLPPAFIGLLVAGPFVVFGPGLLVAGIRQRNGFLTAWAAAIGFVGIFEGFFGITNRLPGSVWAEWEHPAIYLSLGLLTVLAGFVALTRENRVSQQAIA